MSADTDCRKCKAPMPTFKPATGVFAGMKMTINAYRCTTCGHWNDLKRRRKRAEKN